MAGLERPARERMEDDSISIKNFSKELASFPGA